MPLYLTILVISLAFPLLLSFDKKVRFYRLWKRLLPSAFLVGAIYIVADIIFVKDGIWGFNPEYHSRYVFFGLPLEEWLFFLVIPYCCIFIHYVMISYYPDLVPGDTFVRVFALCLIAFLIVILIIYNDRTYTLFNFSLLVLSLIIALFDKSKLLNRYFITFPVILVPFFLVNGILTGTFINGEVVWYNNSEIIGLRLLTIPVEDTGYAFSLVLLNLLVMRGLEKCRFKKSNNSL